MKQGLHLSTKEDTSKPIVSVAIFLKNTNFIKKICIGLIDADDYNTINLYLKPTPGLPKLWPSLRSWRT